MRSRKRCLRLLITYQHSLQLPSLDGPREVIMGRLLGAHQRVVEQRHQRQVLRPLGHPQRHPQRRLGQCHKAQRRTVSLARGPALLA